MIVDILNSFSSFAKPSRPIEYYIHNIHTITLSFIIINFVLKGLTSFALMYYTWLIKIIKERELKENYLLFDDENQKTMKTVNNTHMSINTNNVDLDQSINTSNTKNKRNIFAGDIFEESTKVDNNVTNNHLNMNVNTQKNNDNIYRFNNIREEGMLKQNNKYVEGDVIVENCVFTPNKNVS